MTTRSERLWAALGGAAGGLLLLAVVLVGAQHHPDLFHHLRPH